MHINAKATSTNDTWLKKYKLITYVRIFNMSCEVIIFIIQPSTNNNNEILQYCGELTPETLYLHLNTV